ncbi:flagellar basal body-associated FliL family protein [endosymbiont of unidentified scaly snail isolate Monju]|uniref:flagellar basal body-associated FliL family protein n=1 Tax=endosymbiont of unidentified scaly snail isolate Monju TaxID=1248727 RepID=UPI0003892C49|nr:flagellar basal body-associated FliL family protein [endosymbiont of unidentified scaly snail isolate Monju]BAN69611.1 flagellar FliL protein [endosymbiont of unidentified scaly snail isolate Monju]
MAKDDKDIEGEEGGGGGKKKLILIVGLVVLLLGGGGAAFFLMGGEEPPEDGKAAQAEEEQPKPEAAPEGEPLYVEMEPKFIVNLPPGGPAKMLQIAVTVFTRQQSVTDFIAANDPMLRHHLNNLFESQSSAELLTLEGKQKLQQAVQELLQNKMEEMDQPGKIKAVYFTEFVLQ